MNHNLTFQSQEVVTVSNFPYEGSYRFYEAKQTDVGLTRAAGAFRGATENLPLRLDYEIR